MSYEFDEVEQCIKRLRVPRESGHLFNEVLWGEDLSPNEFFEQSDGRKAYLILQWLNRVRVSARPPKVANRLWWGFEERGLAGDLNTAVQMAAL